MKIKTKIKLSVSDADGLIEKYYEGFTSIREEKLISEFLLLDDLPERFKTEKEIFSYFGHKKQKTHFSILPFIRITGVAAVIISVVFCLRLLTESKTSNYASINGIKTTNMQQIKTLALTSLSEINTITNEVDESFNNLDNHELIEQQLKVFSVKEKEY